MSEFEIKICVRAATKDEAVETFLSLVRSCEASGWSQVGAGGGGGGGPSHSIFVMERGLSLEERVAVLEADAR